MSRGRKLSVGPRGSNAGDHGLDALAEGPEEDDDSDSETDTLSTTPRVWELFIRISITTAFKLHIFRIMWVWQLRLLQYVFFVIPGKERWSHKPLLDWGSWVEEGWSRLFEPCWIIFLERSHWQIFIPHRWKQGGEGKMESISVKTNWTDSLFS